MKLQVVVDRKGLPLGLAAAAAGISDADLAMAALANVPVEIKPGTPTIADRGHDSDPLRDEMEKTGFKPVIPHRKNRVRASRNDGRTLRRYRHRWVVERTISWLHTWRGLSVRWSYYSFMHVGRAYAVFIAIALTRF